LPGGGEAGAGFVTAEAEDEAVHFGEEFGDFAEFRAQGAGQRLAAGNGDGRIDDERLEVGGFQTGWNSSLSSSPMMVRCMFWRLANSFCMVSFVSVFVFVLLFYCPGRGGKVTGSLVHWSFGTNCAGLRVGLEARSGGLEARSGDLEGRSGRLEARSGRLEARSARLEARSGRLETRSGRLEARSGDLEARSGRLEGRRGRLEGRRGRLEGRRGRLKGRSRDLEGRSGRLEARRGDLESRWFTTLAGI
jgi:hypothetical protein